MATVPHPVRIIAAQFVQHVEANRFGDAESLALDNVQWISEWLSNALLLGSEDRSRLSPARFAATVGICRELENCVASSLAYRHLVNDAPHQQPQGHQQPMAENSKSLRRNAAIIAAYLVTDNESTDQTQGSNQQAHHHGEAYRSAINSAWAYACNYSQRPNSAVWTDKVRKFSQDYSQQLADIVQAEDSSHVPYNNYYHRQSPPNPIIGEGAPAAGGNILSSKKRDISQISPDPSADAQPVVATPSKRRKGQDSAHMTSIRGEGSLAWNNALNLSVENGLGRSVLNSDAAKPRVSSSPSAATTEEVAWQDSTGPGKDKSPNATGSPLSKAKSARKDKAPGTGCVKLRHLMTAGLLSMNDKLKAFPKETHAVAREAYIISESGELYDDGDGIKQPFNSVSAWLKQVQVFYKKNSNSSFSCWMNVAVWRDGNWRMLNELLHEYRKSEARSSAAQEHFSKLQFKPTTNANANQFKPTTNANANMSGTCGGIGSFGTEGHLID